MRKLSRLLGIAALSLATFASSPSFAAGRQDFKVCWTIYAGWMPWGEAKTQGIVSKWAKKYGINVDVVQLNDYVESINQYTAGKFDGCAMTNMDALTIPAAGGVDSHRAHRQRLFERQRRRADQGQGQEGRRSEGPAVNLVQFSVSHYLLARALESAGMSERDLKVVNTSDADISAAFATPAVKQAVTWNPMLADLKAQAERHRSLRFQQDSRRDHGHDGRQHEDAAGEPGARQGAHGRVVRDGVADAFDESRQHHRAERDGQGLRHRPRRLQGPALDHRALLHAQGRARLRDQPEPADAP